MTVAIDSPFTAEELEPTLRPLLEASLLRRARTSTRRSPTGRPSTCSSAAGCASATCALAERGAYVTVEVAGESLLFVGDGEGNARGFFNVCRHRGARLLDEPEGTTRRLQCPYHAWSYGFDGTLEERAAHRGAEGFDQACHGLRECAPRSLGGLVFCRPLRRRPPLADHVGKLADQLDRYRNAELRRAARIDYDVEANWKAIVENYSECLHCPGVHPELNRLSHYLSGDDLEGPGAWCGGSMMLNEGAATMAQRRRPAGRRSPGSTRARSCTSRSSPTA